MRITMEFNKNDRSQNAHVLNIAQTLHRFYCAEDDPQLWADGYWHIEVWPTDEQGINRQFEKSEGIYKPEVTMPKGVVRVGWLHDLESATTTNYQEPIWFHQATGTYYFGEG